MAKKTGLGKGLNALFSENNVVIKEEEEVKDGEIPTVKTGDNITQMVLFSCLTLASGLILFFFGVKAVQNNRNKKGA